MTLDELIVRLKQLREEYPQLAGETVGMLSRDNDRQFDRIVGGANMYTRNCMPHSIVIEDYDCDR